MKWLLKSTDANLLSDHVNGSMKRLIEREIADDPDVTDDSLTKIITRLSRLDQLRIEEVREIVVEARQRSLRSEERGTYAGYRAFAIVRYSGSPILWQKKPGDLEWSRYGVINSTAVKVRLYLDSMDPTDAYKDLLADIAPARLAVREFDQVVKDFNEAIEPQVPRFVKHWAAHYRRES